MSGDGGGTPSAREEILTRIRTALGPVRRPAPHVPRDYRTADKNDAATRGALLDLLVDRLQDYRAVVHRVGHDDVAAAVSQAVSEHGVASIVVPAGLPREWTAALGEIRLLGDDPSLTVQVLDTADGVVTGCAVAIAETGTLVLDAGTGQGRRALTLVPDWHLCVVLAAQVVQGVPEGVAALDPVRPLTFVSGPSATSDIELQRVEGVHGPRTLVVVLVGD